MLTNFAVGLLIPRVGNLPQKKVSAKLLLFHPFFPDEKIYGRCTQTLSLSARNYSSAERTTFLREKGVRLNFRLPPSCDPNHCCFSSGSVSMLSLPSPPLPSVGVGRRRGGPSHHHRTTVGKESTEEERDGGGGGRAGGGEEEGKDEKREGLLPHFFLEAFFFFLRLGRGRGRGRTLKQEGQGKGGRIYMPAKKVGEGEAPFLSFSGGRVGRRERERGLGWRREAS